MEVIQVLERRQEVPWSLLANQPDPVDEFQASERSHLKRRTVFLRMTADVVLWPPDIHKCKGKGTIRCCERPPYITVITVFCYILFSY